MINANGIFIGHNSVPNGGSSSYGPEVTDWISRGGSASASQLTAMDALMSNLTSGQKSKFTKLNLFTGDNIASVLLPILPIGASTDVAGSGLTYADYSLATGLNGLNGSTGNKYVKTGITTGAGVLSGHLFRPCQAASPGGLLMGATDAGGPPNVRFVILSGSAPYTFVFWSSTGGPTIGDSTNTYARKIYHIEHTGVGANAGKYYRNGTLLVQGTIGSIAADPEIYVGTYNNNGTPTASTAGSIGLYGITNGTSSATDAANYATHLETYLATIGRN